VSGAELVEARSYNRTANSAVSTFVWYPCVYGVK
jgi:hypothetical protein